MKLPDNIAGLVSIQDVPLEAYELIVRHCAKIAAQRVEYNMRIPCPGNLPGCCVLHSVPASRDQNGTEAAKAILAAFGLEEKP
jgi:hypothetical protein